MPYQLSTRRPWRYPTTKRAIRRPPFPRILLLLGEVCLLSVPVPPKLPTRNRRDTGTDTGIMLKEKRTNSLAFSRTDCHTCASVGRTCDRRRPQCSTCLDLGLKCGGFATPLSWDNNRIWLGQPSQKTLYVYDSNRGNESPKSSSRAFRFVNANSKRKKRRRVSPVRSPGGEHGSASDSPQEAGIDLYMAHPSGSLLDDFGMGQAQLPMAINPMLTEAIACRSIDAR